MTKREKDVYDFIVAYRRDHGFSPTLREIGSGVGLKSPSSVQRYVITLSQKGYLLVARDKMRTLVPATEAIKTDLSIAALMQS